MDSRGDYKPNININTGSLYNLIKIMENEIIEGALPLEEVEANELETEKSDVEIDETEENSNKDNIDFEAELEKERQRLGKKIDKERDKRLEAERNKGITREEAEKIADERVSQMEKKVFRNRAELLAERLAKSSAERDLILHYYDNSIISTGNIEEDIDNAYTLANKKKVQGQISELKKAAQSKKTIIVGDSGGGTPIEQKPKKKYSQDIIDGAKFAGKTPEEFAKELDKK